MESQLLSVSREKPLNSITGRSETAWSCFALQSERFGFCEGLWVFRHRAAGVNLITAHHA